MSNRPKTANYYQPVDPDDGEIMTVAEYLEHVKEGLLMDSDGMGAPVRDGREALAEVDETGWPAWLRPSDGIEKIPEDATHILWMNR